MLFVLSSMFKFCMLGFILIMFNLVRNSHLQLSIFQHMFSLLMQKAYSKLASCDAPLSPCTTMMEFILVT